MAERTRLSELFPRFAQLTPGDFRSLVRALENLRVTIVKVCNLNFGDLDWTAVSSFSNSWVNEGSGTYSDAGYMKIDSDVVMFRGVIKSGTIGLAAFTLPTGYRPVKERILPAVANGAFAEVRVKTDGTVVPNVGSNTRFSLDGLVFRVDV